MKYIIKRYTRNESQEHHEKKLFKAIQTRQRLKKEIPDSYCCIVKIPFRKRHPDFPIWFSLISLLLAELAPEVDSYIRHILQTMQLWK